MNLKTENRKQSNDSPFGKGVYALRVGGGGIWRKLKPFSRLTSYASLILFVLLTATVLPARAELLDTWTWRNPLPQGNSIRSITYGGSTFVAVGHGGTILTSPDGANWTSRTSGTTNDLNGVAYGGSTFVAVGNDGKILTSPDGVTWTIRTSGVTNGLYGVSYGGSTFVAVGSVGKILTSADGVTWTTRTSGTANSLLGVTHGGSTFVTVGSGGKILTSADGVTWTTRTSGTSDALAGVTYGSSTFVTVGDAGKILTSADGVTWTSRTSGTSDTLYGVSYGGSTFIAVGLVGTIVTSPDGVTWTSRTSGTTNNLLSITYGGSTFVAVGSGGKILTSADGVTWTTRTSGTSDALAGVTYGGSTFVAVGGPGTILTSPDGVTWTTQTSGTTDDLRCVAYGGSTFVAGGYTGTILTSPDGVTWTTQTPMGSFYGVTYGGSTFVAISDSGYIRTSPDGVTWTTQVSANLWSVTYGGSTFVAVGSTGNILTSPDGVTWTSQTSGTTNGLSGVTYGGSTFVAVGVFGTILTSPDGVTWTSRTSGTTNSLLSITYGGSTFVAVGYGGTILQAGVLTDSTPPTGTISINSGAASTNSTSATLTFSCTDSSGCAEMQFSNDNTTWSTAEAYATSKTWTLSSGDGTKTVYVKFKDTAGNWTTTTISDTIVLDSTAPTDFIWTGAVNALWSNGANWNTGTAPITGATLYFPAGSSNTTMTNDLSAGTLFNSLNFNGGSYVLNGNAMSLSGGIVNANLNNSGTVTINTNISLAASQTFSDSYSLTVGGTLNLNGFTLAFSAYNSVLASSIIGTGGLNISGPAGINMTGSGSYSAATTGSINLNGNEPNSAFSGSLAGNGTTASITIPSGNRLTPGSSSFCCADSHSIGSLTTGALTMQSGSTYMVDINGVTAGTGYDQVHAVTVSLGGAQLSVTVGATPTLNAQYRIIDNTGVNAVSGTFQGLAEGSTITLNGNVFSISYVGGTGNDVVLTSLNGQTVLSKPANIDVSQNGVKGQLLISWSNPSDADFNHIHIYRSTASGTLGTLIADNVAGIKYTDTGLASLTTYYYTVRAVDNAGNESTNTNADKNEYGYYPKAKTLDATPPAAPAGVTATDATTGGKINLSWTNPTDSDFSMIKIYRSTESGTLGSAMFIGVATSWSNTGLTNGVAYYYTVRAVDTSSNETTNTAQVSATPTAPDATPPAVPTTGGTPVVDTSAGGTLTISWTNPADSDFAFVRIYRSTTSGVLGNLVYDNVTGTSVTDTGLTNNATYYYTIRSVDTAGNESTNTNQISGMPTDIQVPVKVTGVATTLLADGKIRLDWIRSASTDVNAYNIYYDNGTGTIDYNYANKIGTVQHPTTTWTSGNLAVGPAYKFAVRAEDAAQNEETGTTTVVSAVPVTDPNAGDVKGYIKVPQIGQKISGNRVTVVTDLLTGASIDVKDMRLQYKPASSGSWTDITPADASFPNPDTTHPWFTHWDVTGLATGDYLIRAIATNVNLSTDATPAYITVTVDNSAPEASEGTNAQNEPEKRQDVSANAASKTAIATESGVTELAIPEGALSTDTKVTVTVEAPATKDSLVPSGYGKANEFRDITLDSGQTSLSNNKEAEIVIPYKDDNNDNIIDGTTTKVYDTKVMRYNETTLKWEKLDSVVDTANKVVKGKTNHFTLFGLLAPPNPTTPGWNLVSVPLNPSPNSASSVFGQTPYVYNPTTNSYYGASTIAPGVGYWIKGGSNLYATGTETPTTGDFSITLKKGWNMIGNPFRFKVKLSDMKVNYNAVEYTMTQAETNGIVIGTLYPYVNGNYQFVNASDGGTIEAWVGYWILSDKDCTLLVPPIPVQ